VNNDYFGYELIKYLYNFMVCDIKGFFMNLAEKPFKAGLISYKSELSFLMKIFLLKLANNKLI